jgi:hypothetical protein
MIPGREWEVELEKSMSRKKGKDQNCLSAVEVKIREWYKKEAQKAKADPPHMRVWLSKGVGVERGEQIKREIEGRI